MANFASTAQLDAGFDRLIANCDKLIVCAGQPTSYADANGAKKLAEIAVDAGDFTKSNEGGGRKLVVQAQDDVPIVTSGNADHIAFVDVSATELMYVTTATARSIVSGDKLNIGSVTLIAGQPT